MNCYYIYVQGQMSLHRRLYETLHSVFDFVNWGGHTFFLASIGGVILFYSMSLGGSYFEMSVAEKLDRPPHLINNDSSLMSFLHENYKKIH